MGGAISSAFFIAPTSALVALRRFRLAKSNLIPRLCHESYALALTGVMLIPLLLLQPEYSCGSWYDIGICYNDGR